MENPNQTIVNKKFDPFFKNVECAAKLSLCFVFKLKKIEGEDSDISRTRKNYSAGPIETGVHQGRYGEGRRFFQQNWRHWVV